MKALLILSILSFSPIVYSDWAKNLSFKGDLRLRHQNTVEEQAAGGSNNESEDLQRYRLRLKLDAKVTDELKVRMRFASGEGNPTSAEQTFGDNDDGGGFGGKGFFIDRAYAQWQPDLGKYLLPTIYAGKMKNPFVRAGGSNLIWDSDVSPEGVNFRFDYKGKSFGILTNLASLTPLNRSASTGPDVKLTAGQLALDFAVAKNFDLVLGATSYNFSNLKGYAPLFSTASGNTVDGSSNLSFEYELSNMFLEFTWWVRDRTCPIRLYYDQVENSDPTDDNSAHLFGLSLGKTKEKGDWKAGVTVREVQADSMVGALTDSIAFGNGTDGEATSVFFAYNFNGSTVGQVFYSTGSQDLDNKRDFERTQVDMILRF